MESRTSVASFNHSDNLSVRGHSTVQNISFSGNVMTALQTALQVTLHVMTGVTGVTGGIQAHSVSGVVRRKRQERNFVETLSCVCIHQSIKCHMSVHILYCYFHSLPHYTIFHSSFIVQYHII